MSRTLNLHSQFMGRITVRMESDTTYVTSERGDNVAAEGVGFFALREALFDSGIPWIEAHNLAEEVFVEVRR